MYYALGLSITKQVLNQLQMDRYSVLKDHADYIDQINDVALTILGEKKCRLTRDGMVQAFGNMQQIYDAYEDGPIKLQVKQCIKFLKSLVTVDV